MLRGFIFWLAKIKHRDLSWVEIATAAAIQNTTSDFWHTVRPSATCRRGRDYSQCGSMTNKTTNWISLTFWSFNRLVSPPSLANMQYTSGNKLCRWSGVSTFDSYEQTAEDIDIPLLGFSIFYGCVIWVQVFPLKPPVVVVLCSNVVVVCWRWWVSPWHDIKYTGTYSLFSCYSYELTDEILRLWLKLPYCFLSSSSAFMLANLAVTTSLTPNNLRVTS